MTFSCLIQEIPRLRFGMTIYYFGWRERSGDSMKYNEEGKQSIRIAASFPLYHIIAVSFRAPARNRVPFYGTSSPKVISLSVSSSRVVSFRASARNRVPFYGTSSPKVISLNFDHLSSVNKTENFEPAKN